MSGEKSNLKNCKLCTSNKKTSEYKENHIKTYKRLASSPVEKMKYLLKPCAFIAVGVALLSVGISLTVFHFLYEIPLTEKLNNNPPYFTFGPISFASGIIFFMVGVVWFSVKKEKWRRGTAAPIVKTAAAAAAVAASATLSSERIKKACRESFDDVKKMKSEVV